MGGPFGGVGLPPEKPKNFRGTFGRLLETLRPELGRILIVFVFAIVSVSFAVVGPKILGNATDILFDGVVSQQIPPGLTQQQAVDALRAAGKTQQADMLASMTLTPGAGVDFTALRNTLLFVAVIYILSSLFSWAQAYIMAGVSQRTVYRMRRDVDAKLSQLPLRYFDSHPRGDTLSRVTNDIDNIANSLQQTMTQLITAVCTIIGVLAIMFWISPLLAVISLLTVPLSIVVTIFVAKRSQVQFAAQWAQTGKLNGHVEEMHTGHSHRQGVRPAARGDRPVRRGERGALPGQLSSAVPVRHDPAGDAVHRQHQLRPDLRHRRHPGGERPDEPRRRPGLRPVLAPVHDADHAGRQHRQHHPVRDRLGRAGVRAARRGRGGAGRRVRRGPPRRSPGGSSSSTSRSATCPTSRSSRT